MLVLRRVFLRSRPDAVGQVELTGSREPVSDESAVTAPAGGTLHLVRVSTLRRSRRGPGNHKQYRLRGSPHPSRSVQAT